MQCPNFDPCFGALGTFAGAVFVRWADGYRRCPGPLLGSWTQFPFPEPQSVEVVSEIGEGDLGFGPCQADGSDEQAFSRLLEGKVSRAE